MSKGNKDKNRKQCAQRPIWGMFLRGIWYKVYAVALTLLLATAISLIIIISHFSISWVFKELPNLVRDYSNFHFRTLVFFLVFISLLVFVFSLFPYIFRSSRKIEWYINDLWWGGLKLIAWIMLLLFTGTGVYLFYRVMENPQSPKQGGVVETPIGTDHLQTSGRSAENINGDVENATNEAVSIHVARAVLAIIGVLVAAMSIYVGRRLQKLEEMEKKIESSYQNMIVSSELATLSLPEITFVQHIPERFVKIMEKMQDIQFRYPFLIDDLEKSGNASRIFYGLALYNYALGNYDSAIRYLEEKVCKRTSMQGTDCEIRYWAEFRLGVLYRQIRDYAKSEEKFERLEKKVSARDYPEVVAGARLGRGITILKECFKLQHEECFEEGNPGSSQSSDEAEEKLNKLDQESLFGEARFLPQETARLFYRLRMDFMRKEEINKSTLDELISIGESLTLAKEDKAIIANLYETLAILCYIGLKNPTLQDRKDYYSAKGKRCCEMVKSLACSLSSKSFIYSEKSLAEVGKDKFVHEVSILEGKFENEKKQ